MDLNDFDIDQRISVEGKSRKGKNRIKEHGNTWRVKNKFKKGHFPWVKKDSLLLESLKDRITSRWMCLTQDKDFKLI